MSLLILLYSLTMTILQSFLVVSVLPYYKGCLSRFADVTTNSVANGDMTVAKCLHLCEEHTYALLQV